MSFRTLDWIVLVAVIAVGLITVAWTKRYMKSVAVVTTFWIGIGGFRDMVSFIKTLAGLARNDADDGRVVNHHNVGEDSPP